MKTLFQSGRRPVSGFRGTVNRMVAFMAVVSGLLEISHSSRAQQIDEAVQGYLNLSLKAGYQLLSHPVWTVRPWKISMALPQPFEGTTVISGDDQLGWVTNRFEMGEWSEPSMPVVPGRGYVIYSTTNQTVTFVGTVFGQPSITVPVGRSLMGTAFPLPGGLTSRHQFPVVEGTRIFGVGVDGVAELRATAQDGKWIPSEPELERTEGFWVETSKEFVWVLKGIGFPDCESLKVRDPVLETLFVSGETGFTLEAQSNAGPRAEWQWFKDGQELLDQTQAKLQIVIADSLDSGTYYAEARCDGVVRRSQDAKVTEWFGPPRLEWVGTNQLSPQLRILGPSQRSVQLEVSTNLVHWSKALSNPLRLPATVPAPVSVPSGVHGLFFRTFEN